MAKPTCMHQIKRIIELLKEGRSIRETTRLTGLSRNTVKDYLQRIRHSGLSPEQLLVLDDELLISLVYTETCDRGMAGKKPDTRQEKLAKNLDHYNHELRLVGVTRQLLWEEYRKENPDGYGYSRFCEYLQVHRQKDQAVMRHNHRAGEEIQVDFAGKKLGYVDAHTGELKLCEVLVCVLSYSNYLYVEALRSQQQPEFIKGLGNALVYIGGVPQSIKCDNMRTAVTKSNRYEPVLTEAMVYLGEHYGTSIMPARALKPRDKSQVEKGVDLAYKRIYAPLRDKVFHSLEELNAAIRTQLALFNARPFQNKTGSRQQWFESEERAVLKTLPATPYDIKHVTYSKVQRSYHIILGEDRHQYSVPYTCIGKRVKIIYNADTVEVYDNLERIAFHSRNYRKYGFTTLAEHMPPNHREVAKYKGWDDEYFLRQGAEIGTSTHQIIQRVLASKVFPQQTYNSCLGIIRLGKQYGHARLEAACHHALPAPSITYRMIENILKNNLDKITPPPNNDIPGHDQIRGPQSYQ